MENRELITELRSLFLKYLTEDSEIQDARKKEFNQAIFDAKEGFACYTNTGLDMVMEKFDRAIKAYTRQSEPPVDKVEAVKKLLTPYLASPYRHADMLSREILKLFPESEPRH